MIYALESGAKRAGVKVKAFVTVKDECLGVRAWRIAQNPALNLNLATLANIFSWR